MQRLRLLDGLRIGIDTDGCATDHDGTFCRYWNRLNPAGHPLAPSDLKETSFTDPPAEHKRVTSAIFHDARYWIDLPAAYGVGGVIQQLMAWGAHVRLFTARWLDYAWMETHTPERMAFWEERKAYAPVASQYESMSWWMRAVTMEWLRRNHVPYDQLIMDNALCNVMDRFAMAGNGMVDVFIDDNPANVRRLAEHVPVLMPDHWYNRDVAGDNVHRVGQWHTDTMERGVWYSIGSSILRSFARADVSVSAERELAAMALEPAAL